MKKLLAGAAGALVLGLGAGLVWLNTSTLGRIYLPSGTGITAKQTCSLVFVSGLDPEQAQDLYTRPLLGAAGQVITVNLDAERREVSAAVLGLFWRQRAVFREGLGCTLVHGSDAFDPSAALPEGVSDPMTLDVAARDASFDPEALEGALDAAFTEDGRNTLAALVLHDGRLVAERYAEGVDASTRLHGWSMTKSFATTIAGVLAQQGAVDITAEGAIPALVEAGRPDITIEQLLRMTGGLAGHELNDGTDPNSDMLFTESDMARFAATRETLAAPGARWEYQSGNTVLAGAGLEPHLGASPAEEMAALRALLLEPLGMGSAVLEADESGTLQWSSYMYATARDWARLGHVYVEGGLAPDGTRLLPEDWLARVSQPTPGSDGDYGMGFWTGFDDLPAGTIAMQGFQGQYAFIMPAERLVIVRLGATNATASGAGDFARAVLAAKAARRVSPDGEVSPPSP